MELTQLGATGVSVSAIGIGTWRYRGGVDPLRAAISLGATLIDTAEVYGTEGVVGEAIRGRRHEVFLATKVSGDHLRHDDVIAACGKSLQRLGTDYVDLYQVHWPNAQVPIGDTMRAMERLVDEGKVRSIGVSNFSRQELEEAAAAMRKHPIVCNQVRYNLLDRDSERELLPYCQQHGVAFMAYSPLAEGALVHSGGLTHRGALVALQAVARETGRTPAQVALNWCIAKPGVIAIPKASSVSRVTENCQAAGWRLTPEQMERLDQAFA